MKTIDELRSQVRGPVLVPGDAGYDEQRRVHNFMHDRHPAVIVRAAATADAVAAVEHARSNELEIAVRGGGHSVAGFGTCDDGVVLDLGLLNNVFVDPKGRTRGWAAGRRGATSTTPPMPTGWPRPAGSSRPPASRA